MILADSDSEFKQFQGSVNISIYQVLEQTRAIEGLVIEGAKMGGAKLTSSASPLTHKKDKISAVFTLIDT
jgi:hypothetical protein